MASGVRSFKTANKTLLLNTKQSELSNQNWRIKYKSDLHKLQERKSTQRFGTSQGSGYSLKLWLFLSNILTEAISRHAMGVCYLVELETRSVCWRLLDVLCTWSPTCQVIDLQKLYDASNWRHIWIMGAIKNDSTITVKELRNESSYSSSSNDLRSIS
jgi:hypothetical protein